ncbi:class I SAM-dependent methyltransferase [Amycolatopsis sp. H20-H5]|uniref:class I SAM-dependent methyltransferase n=1 Tax=Amycolatopsis sp. H20-H5 TaxID=3046309 RepID=UPI002DB7D7A5|nr:methyltransferase domain-containing protein [Amycolatopsis sp. H20-H5]MEC3974414.1 methyltransferase domain-containing protein [Amycolatopsis sp. H20-H5]
MGVQVVRGYTTDPAVGTFLSARKAAAGAKRAGLSIGDYLDNYSAEPGATSDAVEAMLRLAGFESGVERVCEIGAGSGRYAVKVIAGLKPEVYEVYETAPDWLPLLRTLPSVVVRTADGHALGETKTASVDLVHAHKLFVYIPFATVVGYLEEMVRVVRPGGIVAFDVFTENSLDDGVVKAWIADNVTLYGVLPRAWTIDLLARRGLSLVGTHLVPLSGSHTELLVFRRS